MSIEDIILLIIILSCISVLFKTLNNYYNPKNEVLETLNALGVEIK